jgi:hypothetical protein
VQWTEANREVVLTLVTWPVSIASAQFLIRWDERRLTASELERAWHPSTRDLMTMMLGPLCLPIHAVKTRWSSPFNVGKGLVRGVLGMVLGYAAVEVVGQTVDVFLR